MADYTIVVGVDVEDSKLNALETRINSLKEKEVNLKVGLGNTKQLTKNAQTAVQTISKATAKAAKNTPVIKGANLVEQMMDPEKALKSMSRSMNTLSKYKEGFNLGNKKCEYMLAGIYYKKSLDMYKSLAEEEYDNSKQILKTMPDLSINFDEVLTPPFKEINLNEEEEEYVPIYILEKDENLKLQFEKPLEEMIIDK